MAKIKSPHHTSSHHKHKPKGVTSKAFEKVYWPYIPLILALCLVLGLTYRNGVLASMIKKPVGQVLAYASSISPSDLLNDTNDARVANGVKPLTLNTELARAAQAKANDMAARNYWSHNTPAGNPPWIFVEAQNYQYEKIGENLAAGFSDSLATINGWMASPHHRENMLDPAFSEVGFGFANNPDYSSSGYDGPMTIVVAFYGEPQGQSVAAATGNGQQAGSGQTQPKSILAAPKQTSRAQLAFMDSPLSNYGSLTAIIGLTAVISVWLSRHLLGLRRTLTQGERYIATHPLFDLGLLLLGLAFFTLTRTAGLIQ